MTKAKSDKIVRWFKANVSLCDWDIEVGDAISIGGEFLGAQTINLMLRSAAIMIVPDAHKGGEGEMGDEEHTLLHELVYCFFDECDVKGEGERFEFCVDRLARMLLRQYRSDNA